MSTSRFEGDWDDLNSGKPWTEMAIDDLITSLASGETIERTAFHLCRSRKEVEDKARELGIALSPKQLSR
jgi:hypothetical protein